VSKLSVPARGFANAPHPGKFKERVVRNSKSVAVLAKVCAALIALLSLALAQTSSATTAAAGTEAKAIFAGGCFWCMEPPFQKLPGVMRVVSGYSGGGSSNPTYAQVSAGNSGHLEVVEVIYDSARISYSQLLDVYWRNVDPTVANRQFCDVGPQYRSAIFVATPEERRLAEASKAGVAANPRFSGRTIHTEILDAAPFWPAEDYHQDYAEKNPLRYRYYRWGCGRDARLREIWGDEAKE
jgi:peptide-methionine (S)-S-oxide reductase